MFSGAKAELSTGNVSEFDNSNNLMFLFIQGPQANTQTELPASAQTELPTKASPGPRHPMLTGKPK